MSPPPAAGTSRLFLALWPGPAALRSLCAWRDRWLWPAGAALVSPERLHLTLHFIGSAPNARLAELATGLAVPFRRFELAFGQGEVWRHGVAVLNPERVPERLAELHAALGEALLRLGLPLEARPFRPHLTLARRASGAVPPPAGPALRWRVHSYLLMQSQGGYRALARYP